MLARMAQEALLPSEDSDALLLQAAAEQVAELALSLRALRARGALAALGARVAADAARVALGALEPPSRGARELRGLLRDLEEVASAAESAPLGSGARNLASGARSSASSSRNSGAGAQSPGTDVRSAVSAARSPANSAGPVGAAPSSRLRLAQLDGSLVRRVFELSGPVSASAASASALLTELPDASVELYVGEAWDESTAQAMAAVQEGARCDTLLVVPTTHTSRTHTSREELLRAVRLNCLRNNKLVQLQMNGVALRGACELVLARFLRTNPALRELYLEGCEVGCGGAYELALALRCNSNLESLDLAHNAIGDVGAFALASALDGHNATLRDLYLHGNAVRSLRCLALMLGSNAGLREIALDAGREQPRDVDAFFSALVHAMQRNRSLTALDLGELDLEQQREGTLASLLGQDTRLRELSFRGPLADPNLEFQAVLASPSCCLIDISVRGPLWCNGVSRKAFEDMVGVVNLRRRLERRQPLNIWDYQ
jgi:hypothetical protein